MQTLPSAPVSDLLISVVSDDLPPCSWQEALELMASRLAELAALPSAAPLVESAMQREDCEPTYLGKGMALPHARVAGLPCAGICVAHSLAGIAWHEQRAHLVVFLAVPEEAPELYLKLLSRLVRWRLSLAEELLSCRSLPAEDWERELRSVLAPVVG